MNKEKDSIDELIEKVVKTDEEEELIVDKNTEDEKIEYTFGNKKYKLTRAEIDSIEQTKPVLQSFIISHFDILEKLSKNQERFAKAVESLNSLENILTRMASSYSNQFVFLHEQLKELQKKDVKLNTVYNDTITTTHKDNNGNIVEEQKEITLKDTKMSLTKNLKGKTLSGESLKLYMFANNRNVKKVYLPNSGFYVILRCPSLSELNVLYNRLNDVIGEYGYLFGNYFYLYHDFKIKEVFMEMIREYWIVNSNLSGWNKGNTFYKNLSILDYDSILYGISSLMFKHGYDFIFQCSNEKCLYRETVTIDLNEIRYYILSKIPKKCLEELNNPREKNTKILKEYRNSLELTDTISPVSKYKLYLEVPTMEEYFEFASKFNAELADAVHDTSLEKINTFIRYSYFKLFTPWISRIDVLDENGSINFNTVDKEGIEFVLSTIQDEYTDELEDFIKPIVNFIQNNTLTLIAILMNPCPKCKTIPENAIEGLLPIDIQENFFLMSMMKLRLH